MKLLGAFALVSLAVAAAANDGYSVLTGGAWNFGKSKDIRLIREDLKIRLVPRRGYVDVTFQFQNTGTAQTATMAFPEYTEQETSTGCIQRFRVSVDGRSTPATYQKLGDAIPEYEKAWLHKVAFGKGQTRQVRVRYWAKMGDNSSGAYTFDYILKTAATWSEPVKEIKISVDASALPKSLDVVPQLLDQWTGKRPNINHAIHWTEKGKRKLCATLKNLIPAENLTIFIPRGFWHFTLNGMPLEAASISYQVAGPSFSQWQKGRLWIPEQAVPYIFRENTYNGSENPEGYPLPSRHIVWTDKTYGAVHAYAIADLVKARGGRWRYNSKTHTIEIVLPHLKP